MGFLTNLASKLNNWPTNKASIPKFHMHLPYLAGMLLLAAGSDLP